MGDGDERDSDNAGPASPRTMAAKQMEMELELQQLRSMLTSVTGPHRFDPSTEPDFVLSDEHRFALQHRRYHEDSSDSDDDDYTQFDQRRRKMERVLVRELKTLNREKDMIRSVRSLRRDRDILLEKQRVWEQERLALINENDKLQPAVTHTLHADTETEALGSAQCAVAKLNYVEWSVFTALRQNSESESFAIDVLKGEPIITFDYTVFWRHKKVKKSSPKKAAEAKPAAASTKTDAKQKQLPVPERIRIHSKSILKILEDISGETLSASGDPVVMIRPYKFLIYHEEQIRLKFSELKDKFGGGGSTASGISAPEQAATDPKAEQENAEKDNDTMTTSLVDYEQLGCLVEFLDMEIQPKVWSLSRDAGENRAKTGRKPCHSPTSGICSSRATRSSTRVIVKHTAWWA
jgi:hypothetical protein